MLGSVDASGLRLVSAWPAWFSPIGWGQQMRPFGGDHWWPIGLFALAFVVLSGMAAVLATRRDAGSSISSSDPVAPRPHRPSLGARCDDQVNEAVRN